jgi:hypothetical protein
MCVHCGTYWSVEKRSGACTPAPDGHHTFIERANIQPRTPQQTIAELAPVVAGMHASRKAAGRAVEAAEADALAAAIEDARPALDAITCSIDLAGTRAMTLVTGNGWTLRIYADGHLGLAHDAVDIRSDVAVPCAAALEHFKLEVILTRLADALQRQAQGRSDKRAATLLGRAARLRAVVTLLGA